MSPILIKTIQFFLSLSLLIVLHELGHFIPAKLFKTRVEKFYLFFDIKYSLFKKKIGETVYGIGWLPLGGYVKIAGMIDESMDTEQMAQPPKPWEFRSKPAWQRLIIMLGGVTVNFVLAVIIYIGMAYAYGDQFIPTDSLRDGVWVTEKNIGDKLGIETGDKILAIDGEYVENFNSLLGEIINGNTITIERGGQVIEKEIPVDFIATLLEDEDKIRFLSPRIPFVIGNIPDNSANKDSGIKEKDLITAVGGEQVTYFDEVREALKNYSGQNTMLTVEREGRLEQIPVVISDSATIGIYQGAMTFADLEEKG
ncbi:MAG: RIP metalloprotease RseP, partial [Eudoraea sp.]|nr:site-2 protease family protein [Eudoraea sp.]NNJ39907.1 RIP metalloprotease RseP [Eudoraea sp.]